MWFKRLITVVVIVAIGFLFYTKNSEIIDYAASLFNKAGLELMDATGYLIKESEIKNLEDSGIKYKNYSFDVETYPYYGMLSKDQKDLYKQVYANASKLSTTFVPGTRVDVSLVGDAIQAVFNDHPELFWLNTNYVYKYTYDNKCCQIILEFNELSTDIDNAKYNFELAVNNIINNANNYSSGYQKELYVHDTLIKNVNYDVNAKLNQSAYSALVLNNSVCAGYARAFQYIMQKMGYTTYYVVGYSSGNHAWNMIRLDDAEFYNVDVTWDDQKNVIYKFFNMNDQNFSNHERRELSLNLPSCLGTKYSGYINYSTPKKVIPRETVKPTPTPEVKETPEVIYEVIPDENNGNYSNNNYDNTRSTEEYTYREEKYNYIHRKNLDD